jgi:hypothetical protein
MFITYYKKQVRHKITLQLQCNETKQLKGDVQVNITVEKLFVLLT